MYLPLPPPPSVSDQLIIAWCHTSSSTSIVVLLQVVTTSCCNTNFVAISLLCLLVSRTTTTTVGSARSCLGSYIIHRHNADLNYNATTVAPGSKWSDFAGGGQTMLGCSYFVLYLFSIMALCDSCSEWALFIATQSRQSSRRIWHLFGQLSSPSHHCLESENKHWVSMIIGRQLKCGSLQYSLAY